MSDWKVADSEIAKINEGLTKVRLMRRGGSLSLRATLPKKGKVAGNAQQTVPLGIKLNSSQPPKVKSTIRNIARQKAMELEIQILQGSFDWSKWSKVDAGEEDDQQLAGYWIDRAFASKANEVSVETLANAYKQPFSLLPRDLPITEETIISVVESNSAPKTRTRRGLCLAYAFLAKFAGVPIDLGTLGKGYKPKPIDQKLVPTAEQIIEEWERLTKPEAKWMWAVLATYGCRPHELWHADISTLEMEGRPIRITGGKTGARMAYPFPMEWVDRFNIGNKCLREIPPGLGNKRLSSIPGELFKRQGCKYGAKYLRHAFAVRTEVAGFPGAFIARWQGHSQAVHDEVYQRSIGSALDAEIAIKFGGTKAV